MTARLLLMNPYGENLKLYHRLCWLFAFGFIMAVLMMLAKNLNSADQIQNLFERLFMLFIFITALMLLNAWRVVPQLIIPFINPQKNYFIRSVKLLCVLIPLIILSNAIIGLIGFINLAWAICKYEGIFLLVTTGYLILRGLSKDILYTITHRLIHRRTGWLYVEAFLKPFSFLLHFTLFYIKSQYQ